MPITFVTGPVRSGKSLMAQGLASESGFRVTYVATAKRDPGDEEWSARIDRHAHDRPQSWSTLESADLALADFNKRLRDADADECLLIDALGTWLGVRIGERSDRIDDAYAAVESALEGEANDFADALEASRALVVIVAEQVGWDVVPVHASARLFRDVLGRLCQRLARQAETAYLVVAGHRIVLNDPV
jgi:adenosylcobinamide kinase/adenosylcobinamide-phosphate guanylyltransferase